MKKIISAIQPTNSVTLGNYLGAIKNFVLMQNDYEMIIFVADLHALSSPDNQTNICQNTIDIVKTYLACGLDPHKVTIFRQSDLPQHDELFNVLLNFTTIGELNRMTQYKDKSLKLRNSNGTEFITTSLLTYPVLMAADILLHDADLVIVGQDQKQHLELTRNIAKRINNKFKKEIFKMPEIYINETSAKILDLLDTNKKMSKSNTNKKGVIFLNDDTSVIEQKIKSALTDNYNMVKFNEKKQPAISNLINIYATINNLTIKEVESQFKNIKNYGEFKKELSNKLCNFIKDFQNKFKKITDKQALSVLNEGLERVEINAKNKMNSIYKGLGIK